MASYRGQVVVTYCKTCKSDQEMKPQREGFEGKIIWLKCQSCSDMLFIKKDLYDELLATSQSKGAKVKGGDYIDYDPHKNFKVGQLLYHPVWDDKGEVLKKETTSSGRHSIKVAFDKLGEKILIENLTA